MANRYPPKFKAADAQRREVTLIAIGRKLLNLDDETYYNMLSDRFGVDSSTKLDAAQRRQLLDHFKQLGFEPTGGKSEWAFIDKASADRQPLLRKICAVCIALKVGKAYAEGAAKRQHGIERKLEMMDVSELHALVGALERTRKSKEQSK
jgi:hypothetical protein